MNSEAKTPFLALLQCVTKRIDGSVSANNVKNNFIGFTTVTVK